MPTFSDLFKSRRNMKNCIYRKCVECNNDVDCSGNLVCVYGYGNYGKCITRQQKQKLEEEQEEKRQRDQQQAAIAAYNYSQQLKRRNEK